LEKKKLLQDATLFSASLLLSRLLLSIRGIIIPKFLGPSLYGIYNGLFIIPDFLVHFHFGSLSALKREIPFCYGKGDLLQAQRIRNIVFTQYMGATVLAALLLFLTGIWLRGDYSSEIIISLWLISILVVIQAFVDAFLENLLRTDNRFDILSQAEIFKSFFGFFLLLIMIWYWGLAGLIASIILATVLKGVFIYKKTVYRLYWVWDFAELKRLIIIGFPIIVGLLLFAVYNSVDRMVIAKYLGSRPLGYYALGLTIAKFLLIAQGGVYGILEPRIYQRYSELGEIQRLKKIVLDPMLILTLFFPLVMGLAYIGSPYLVYLLLPKYVPSLGCIHILILGSFFFIFLEGAYTFIVAINRQMFIVWVIGFWTVAGFVLNYLLIVHGWGIEGVAAGTAGINLMAGITFLGLTINHFYQEVEEKIRIYFRLFFPFLWVGIPLVLMDRFWPISGSLQRDYGIIVLKGLILLIINIPLILMGKKKIGQFYSSGAGGVPGL
jgi:O-antigen/teichoic acid export membrane protein